MKKEKVWYEEFKVEGEKLLSKCKELIHEGNIRRLIIKNEKGKTLLEVPLTIGVVGAIFLPSLAAISAIAVLVTHCTIVVERVGEKRTGGNKINRNIFFKRAEVRLFGR